MKKILVISLLLIAGISLKAQEQFKYDTLIYYPQEVAGCANWTDSFINLEYCNTHDQGYYSLGMLNAHERVCCQPYHNLDNYVIGSGVYAQGFAQPFHFDSTMIVCGVAARVIGWEPDSYWCYFELRDTKTTTAFANLAYSHRPSLYTPTF